MSIHARVRIPGSDLIGSADLVPNGSARANCTVCGHEVAFYPLRYEEIVAIACKDECYDAKEFWYEPVGLVCSPDPDKAFLVVQEKPRVYEKPKHVASQCAVVETDEIIAAPVVEAKKLVATCPSCNGPLRGRGYNHADGCPKSTKAKLAADKMARQEAKKAKLAKIPKKVVCPSCGGPRRRGRGMLFTHLPECPELRKD